MNPTSVLLISFLLAFFGGPPLIARLRSMALKQTAYEDAPKTHQKKSGTPTMGGVLFLVAPLVTLVAAHDLTAVALSVLMIGCALIGMIDDIAAIKKHRNRGLSARAKFLATIAVALVFLAIAHFAKILPAHGFLYPSLTAPIWLIFALGLFAILGTTHGVNLTDGLDGLAGGCVIPPLAVAALLAMRSNLPTVALFDLALIGAVAGFLVYNRHPAKVFMGDTGALALGGALAGSIIISGATIILPIIGGVFVAEALSVILQVASFKTTGKRIFRMSPLHHHFELGGAAETQVTRGFWAASTLCAVVVVAVLER